MSRLNRLRTLGGLRGRALSGSVAASDLLSQIQTPTLAYGDIKTGATPWYSDAGTTPAVPTNGVYRLTEHIAGTNYAQQTTAGSRPTLTDGTPYDRLTFDGGDKLVTAANIGESGDFAAEVVCVGAFGGDSQALWHMGGTTNGTGFALINLSGLGGICIAFEAWYESYGAADTSLHVYRAVKTAGTVSAGSRLFIDGVEASATGSGSGGNTPNMTNGVMTLGSHPTAGLWLTGSILALIYYATPLASDALRAADDAAIATYFGL